MKKHFKFKNLLGTPEDEQGVEGLVNKLQQQLIAIEKKLDILINQSQKGSFEKSYSKKPFRNFDQSNRQNRGRQGDGPRERTFTRAICAGCNKECEIPFKPSGDRPVYCKQCFSKREKSNVFNPNRDKKQGGKRQKPDQKKSSFFSHRKKRA
ncbi:MAG: CxxC-x17-CxxC domain-containing protein [bacterium]